MPKRKQTANTDESKIYHSILVVVVVLLVILVLTAAGIEWSDIVEWVKQVLMN